MTVGSAPGREFLPRRRSSPGSPFGQGARPEWDHHSMSGTRAATRLRLARSGPRSYTRPRDSLAASPIKTPSRRSGYVPLMEPASVHTRFLRAVDYIEDHLSEPIALADVAKQAGFSLHYFARLFRVLTGETFGAYLRARRMTLAAERLLGEGRELKLIELAFSCGYDSQEAFTRAFKRTFGVTPGEYRRR